MSAPQEQIPEELARALYVLLKEGIGDFVYNVRDREGKGWDGPRVKAWGGACEMVEKYAAQMKLTREEAIALLPEEHRQAILEALQQPAGDA